MDETCEEWFWGPADRSVVDTCLQDELDGAFLVFEDVDTDQPVLAYRQNSMNVYKDIIFRDHYYGFTEPLSFESLSDLLNAYNWSPVTTDVLLTPVSRPNSMVEGQINAIDLLLKIRETETEISTKLDDRSALQTEIRLTDECTEKLQQEVDGLNKVLRILQIQIDRHKSLRRRLSSSSSDDAMATVEGNNEILLDRQSKVNSSKSEKEASRKQSEERRNELQKEYDRIMLTIDDLQKQQEIDIRLLLRYFPELREYVDCLLQEISRTYPDPVVHDIRAGEATQQLQGKETGTFLFRRSRKNENVPFVLSVCFQDTVVHFPVYKIDRYYGLDEILCIFDSLQDLVSKYAVIPFSFHGEYGDLKLYGELMNNSRAREGEMIYKRTRES